MPPSENTNKSEIWDETWKRVDRFLPELYKEIFPRASPPASLTKTETSEKSPPRDKEPSSKLDEAKVSPASD